MRVKTTSRKNVPVGMHAAVQPRMRDSVWHPALTKAAELGEQHLDAALDAKRELVEGFEYEVDVRRFWRHSGVWLPDGSAAEVPQSPFPAGCCFGILPYAAWHGHLTVVHSYLDDLLADRHAQVPVPTEPLVQVHVNHGSFGRSQEHVTVTDTVPTTALQIAVWKRDTRMVKLLRVFGVNEGLPFLLDMAPPRPDTLFASKAGEWSQEGHWCFPPAFKAAVRELLLISHKHGGVRRRDGQLRWGFTVGQLQDLLLPAMGRGSMTAWVKPDDQLPEDSDDEEGSSEAAGSEEEEQE